jgi:A/G-specific adenine glycosylase
LHGKFPDTYEDILKLNGIGTYTAAAISSFAFNLPYAVLDGNVFRILSRIYDIHIPVDSTEGKNLFKKTAQELLPVKKSAEYNQAIMDFGAIICSPLPKCTICFCNKFCISYKNGEQNNLPVKLKKIKIRERWLTYFLIVCDNEILIHKRIHKDIWHQLFEFLLIETDHKPSHQLLSDILNDQYNLPNTIFSDIEDINQKLSHQLIHFSFKMIHATTKISIIDYIWISKNELIEYPFPKTLLQVVLKHFK